MAELTDLGPFIGGDLPGAGQQAQQGAAPPNPLLMAHRLLRGRYWLGAPLGLMLAVIGAVVGYLATEPKYTSTGIVRIAPVLPSLLYRNEENQNLPNIDSFVATQLSLLSESRVMEFALQSEALRNAGWPPPPEGTKQLQKALEVVNPRRSLLLLVTVSDSEPKRAQAAVNAILDGYQALYVKEPGGLTLQGKVTKLEEEQRSLASRLASLRENIVAVSAQQGLADIGALLASRTEDFIKLEKAINEIELQVALGESQEKSPVVGSDPATPNQDPEALAERDAQLRELLARLKDLQQRDAVLAAQAFGAKHKIRERLADEITEAQAAVNARVSWLVANTPSELRTSPARGDRAMTLNETKNLLEQYKIKRAKLAAEVKELSQGHLRVGLLQDEVAETSKNLGEVTDRLRQLVVEKSNIEAGRISIDGRPSLPAVPSTDRRIPLAAGGGAGGLALGLAIPALLGLLFPRHRYIDEVEAADSSVPFLGTMPDLGKARGPEATELASLAVHHIRNLLLLRTKRAKLAGGCVLLVTSPGPGDGKTSLCMALGASFAVGNFKTILVDADLCGHGLTRRNGLDGRDGFSSAVLAGKANGELVQLGSPNLSVLPIGDPEKLRPEELSHDRLESLLTSLRQNADIVLIDSGPVLGSLEATLLAPDVDGVVVVCSRGGSPKLTASTIAKLRALSAKTWGLVFNRADFADVISSASRTSIVSRSVNSQSTPPGASSSRETSQFVDAILKRQ